MIQRKQNLYLAFIVILCLVLSFSAFRIAELNFNATDAVDTEKIVMTYSKNFTAKNEFKTSTIGSAKVQYVLWCIALFALLSIISFKNLRRQITFCSFNFAFMLFLPVFAYLDYNHFIKTYPIAELQIMNTAIIPIALILLNILAVRGIIKDHNLLKSMDRIR